MNPSQTDYPPMKDLTIDNLTENVNLINSGCKNPRLKYLIEALVQHVHAYCRETRLSMTEWTATIDFLTAVGQKCTSTRQEFTLLSDVLGISLLVDAIDHPKPAGATDGTVLGPFHTTDAREFQAGQDIDSDPEGETLLIYCIVKDMSGNRLSNVKLDVWETDSKGFYDVQYKDRDGPHGRAILHTDNDGVVFFRGNVPVSYPVPVDGPVGDLLRALSRHPYRPAHVHFMFEKEGYDHLITALTIRGDPYEAHDPVFGVKQSLIEDITVVDDNAMAERCGVEKGTKLLSREFVLVRSEDASKLRHQQARDVMARDGQDLSFHDGMPVPGKTATDTQL